jgi:hypothetical protein
MSIAPYLLPTRFDGFFGVSSCSQKLHKARVPVNVAQHPLKVGYASLSAFYVTICGSKKMLACKAATGVAQAGRFSVFAVWQVLAWIPAPRPR